MTHRKENKSAVREKENPTISGYSITKTCHRMQALTNIYYNNDNVLSVIQLYS